ncbi:MAG: sulfite exporter TauE/SafE family protein [Nitrospirota bacterium]|nr:sulfite exporter TauE/SafE family protein [Nitrospirota bacterium]
MEYINLFLIGAVYGFTTCSLTCLPYLAPYMMGVGGGFKGGMRSSLFFVFGKVATYAAVSGAAAMLGQELIKKNEHDVRVFIGLSLVVVGVLLFMGKEGGCKPNPLSRLMHSASGRKSHLFVLGILTSLIPCVPLSSLLLLSAKSGSVTTGAAYGFVYGAGLILSPLILAGGFFAFVSERIRMEIPDMRVVLRRVSAAVLIATGVIAAVPIYG